MIGAGAKVLGPITIGDNVNQQTFSWNDTSNQLPISNEATKKCCRTNNTIIWHFE